MVMAVDTSSKAAEAIAGFALIGMVCVTAIAVFRDRPYEKRAPLIVGAIALSLVYNRVRDGSEVSLWFIPLIIFVLIPVLIDTLRKQGSVNSDGPDAKDRE